MVDILMRVVRLKCDEQCEKKILSSINKHSYNNNIDRNCNLVL